MFDERLYLEDLIRKHTTGSTPELKEQMIADVLAEFDRYLNGRTITIEEVRNFADMKAYEQDSVKSAHLLEAKLAGRGVA